MNLLVTPVIWREIAQNDLGSCGGFSGRAPSHSIVLKVDGSSKTSARTSQYRYPSPSKRFGTFGSGPLFFARCWSAFEQRSAEKQPLSSGDSLAKPNLLSLPVIKTIIGGIKQCRSNTWHWLPFLSRRLPVASITTLNARALARLRALLSSALRVAVCSPVRLLVPAQVRCVTISAFATNLTHKNRTAFRPKTTTYKTTTAGIVSRWFLRLVMKNRCRGGAEYLRKAC